jgi:hypothetical protein
MTKSLGGDYLPFFKTMLCEDAKSNKICCMNCQLNIFQIQAIFCIYNEVVLVGGAGMEVKEGLSLRI